MKESKGISKPVFQTWPNANEDYMFPPYSHFLKDQGLPDTEAYQSTLLLSSQKQNAVICDRENCNYYIIYIA